MANKHHLLAALLFHEALGVAQLFPLFIGRKQKVGNKEADEVELVKHVCGFGGELRGCVKRLAMKEEGKKRRTNP